MYRTQSLIMFIYLLVLSISDLRYHKVSGKMLNAGLLAVIAGQCITKSVSMVEVTAGIAVGVLFIGISFLTKEQIGYGDSILILILGIFCGIKKLFFILCVSFFLSAAVSVLVLSIKKHGRKYVLPFIPFLMAGYLICKGV